MAKRKLTRNAEESEKAIERYLCELTKQAGGLPLKYYNPNATGYPDRILIFPDGEVIWVEVKSRGEHPTALQYARMTRLRDDYRQTVYVCDSRARAEEIVLNRVRKREHREAQSRAGRPSKTRKEGDE